MTARVAWSLAVVALIGLLVLDLVYVFDSQRALARERRYELAWVATSVAADIRALERIEAHIARVAAEHHMVITVVGNDGRVVQSQRQPTFASLVYASAPLAAHGYEHLAVRTEAKNYSYVIVSRPLKETIDNVMRRQPRILMMLIAIAVAMTGLSLVLMRHTVLQPLERSENDRLQVEQQLAELMAAHRELEATKDRLVRAERLAAVGRLAAGLAHEVGNPLAILTGYSAILRDLPREEQGEILTRMEKELARIQSTVRSLLDYARAPSGVAGSTQVAPVVDHVHKLVQSQATKKLVQVTTAIEDHTVAISNDALTQVLLNLTLNALDAVPSHATVAITANADAITVEDSGPGIADDIVERLFEPFFTTKPAGVGTGLGLSVCESLVTAAHGNITADRSPTLGGARFRIVLPKAPP